MTEERPIVEEILDYAFFAPVGLALTIAEDLPALVDRGRRQIEGQFGIARFVAKMAAKQALRRFENFLDTPTPPTPPTSPTTTTVEPIVEPPPTTPTTVLSSDSLAIAGYDSLAASQVVARLSSLDPSDLEAIRAYESATRRRQTILNRIAQIGATRD
jgi:hypothetical protein